MTFDYYAVLYDALKAERSDQKALIDPSGLSSGYVDECTAEIAKHKISKPVNNKSARKGRKDKHSDAVRDSYMKTVSNMLDTKRNGLFKQEIDPSPDFARLPDPAWIGFEVSFKLFRPWYAKDDRVFHVMDNPLRKDRVFGVPFMSASSWKGLLRWAFRLTTGRIGPDPEPGEKDIQAAAALEGRLFGHDKNAPSGFQQGSMVFYPTWFDKIDFEVINPHDRETRAGTQPIFYEVVPSSTEGVLRLLYAPLPGMVGRDQDERDAIKTLLVAIESLLTVYGISAKRTGGWGTAQITEWKAYKKGEQPIFTQQRDECWSRLKRWLEVEANE